MPYRPLFGPATLSLHAGQSPDSDHGARAVPIHFTTSYVFADADQAAARFNLERPGHVYSRISNPTNAVLEERIAALEGAVGAIATASGQAALHLAIVTLMGAGGHIVASRALYGGSHNLLAYTLPRFGIETTFVDPRELDDWRAAIRPNTALLFGESLGNPGLEVLDIPRIAELAHERALPLLVDATLATPCLQQPIELGADLVLHSATKFLGGHGVAVGGLLVDGGRFDWLASGRFPTLTEPYDGFHGMAFADESPITAFLLRARREGLRDFGACLSPMNAFQILQGIETLPLRMRQHVSNTQHVAEFLAAHDDVARVSYPGAGRSPRPRAGAAALAARCWRRVELRVGGWRAAGAAFIGALRVFSHLANVGDAKSLVIHPASTTHFRMSARRSRRGRHRRRHHPPVDRPRRRQRSRRGHRTRPARGGQGGRMSAHAGQAAAIFAYTGGQTLRADQPTVVFVHGAGHDHSVWNLPARHFAHHGMNALAPDLPGHGRSDGSPLDSIEAMADWLFGWLEATCDGPVSLVGHSMGSLIALRLAATHPSRCAHLALVGSVAPMPVAAPLLAATQNARDKAHAMINQFSFAPANQLGASPLPGISLTGVNRRLMERAEAGVLHADMSACNAYASGLEDAAHVTLPDRADMR